MKQRRRLLCGAVMAFTAAVVHADLVPAPATAASVAPPAALVVDETPSPAAAAMALVSAARISDHVNFLASDLLEGRGTGSRGGQIAAAYIATQFALSGLQPRGDHGSYLQTLNLTGIATLPQTRLSLDPSAGSSIPLKYGNDYLATDETSGSTSKISAPIVFVGYGVNAPELQHDDYDGVNVHGKIVLMFDGLPPADSANAIDSATAIHDYASSDYKFAEAAREGALGAILIHIDDPAQQSWQTLRDSLAQGRLFLADDGTPRLHAAVWIQEDVARVLFAASGRSIDTALASASSSDFKAAQLPVEMNGQVLSEVRHLSTSNVVGMLPGAQPGTPRQVVMYSAHYDHLGSVNGLGGAIYNGAVDNASGVGMLLELAQACAHSPQRPPHAMLFVATAGGDRGQLGARYLSRHLPVPAADLALALNFDTVPPVGVPESIVVSNARRSRFLTTVKTTAEALHLRLEPGGMPHAGGVGVAETLPFARLGIPTFSINEGLKFAGHSREWGASRLQDYLVKDYRQVTDKYRPEMDFSGNAKLVRYALSLGWSASARAEPVRWLPGDAFGARQHPPTPSDLPQDTSQP